MTEAVSLRVILRAVAVVAALTAVPAVADDDGPTPPGTIFSDCSDCPELVVIPAGTAEIGAGPDEIPGLSPEAAKLEQPRHRVAFRSFALGRTTITRSQFSAFVFETGYDAGGACEAFNLKTGKFERPGGVSWLEPGFVQGDKHPVVCVNIKDINAYLAWLGKKTKRHYRLPTEAEWEYAARAGTDTPRYWGAQEQCRFANGADRTAVTAGLPEKPNATAACTDGHANTAPVGSFAPNAFRLTDMLGNVAQWVADCRHDSYEGAPNDGSAWGGEAECQHGLRGGAWMSAPSSIRASRRSFDPIDAHGNGLGFRIARDIE